MPIKSYSGKPGNGKTALMMERLIAESTKGERPIFQSGIDGITPGLAVEIKDPRTWNDLDPSGPPECTCDKAPEPHCHVLRNGALWFVDEAWKWFGHLHDASRQATPLHVLALAEHRHRGIDMVWTFQGPNQIYPFARPLMDEHHHTVRRFGTPIIDVYKWEELQEDVKSTTRREAALRETRALPKAVFGMYKSADAHTIKARIPKRVLVLPLLVLGAGFAIWIAYSTLKPSAFASSLNGEGPNAGLPASGRLLKTDSRDEEKPPITAAEYARKHLPRFAAMPWTAPIYDDREVTADPLLICMIAGAGEDANGERREESCRCVTEQNTPYDIADGECRRLARQGPVYNPYRKPSRGAAARPVAGAERGAPAPGSVIEADQISGYGDIEVGSDG